MKKIISIKAGFVGKVDDIDRSTLYTLYTCDGRFQLLHADVRNLEFLGKYATDPKYCLLFLDLQSLCPSNDVQKINSNKNGIF